MIPLFDESGCLPSGVHPATLDEIEARFGRLSELRRVQMESLRWMVDLAVQAKVQRIVVDCVLLVEPHGRGNRAALGELRKGLPFLDLAIVRAHAFDEYVQRVFATDRTGAPKGMIEVVQWT
jgi:hypothetical protein